MKSLNNCQRCNEPGPAPWRIKSDILDMMVCTDCAVKARELMPYPRPYVPGDMEILGPYADNG